MPGLLGCVSRQSLDRGLLRAMAKPMLHRADYQVHEHADEHFISAAINLASDRQSGFIKSPDDRYAIVFFGSLYESWAGSKWEILKTLLSRWKEGGWHGLADLNGEYLVMVWNYLEKSLTVVNDRLGLQKLCYWADGATFAWASEVKALAVVPQVSRTVDEHALSELLTFGHLQDDRTLLRDVKLMPPGSCLEWRNGTFSIQSYWQYEHQADPALEYDETVIREYAFHVSRAVSRRMGKTTRTGLFLSGGLDSRALAGMMRRTNPRGDILTWTTGHGHDHDSRYARQIAKTIGAKHTSVTIPETFLEDHAAEYAWILDGAVTADGCHRALLCGPAEGKVDLFFNGFLGDVLSGGKPFDKVLHLTKLDDLTETGFGLYAMGFDDFALSEIFRPAIYGRIRGLALEAFRKTVCNARVEHPADRVVHTELIQRQRLGNPRIQVDFLNSSLHTATPFTDKDFIDFTLRLPMNQRIGRRAYLRMIVREFPELARISKSGDGLPLIHSRFRASLHWRWVLLRRRFGGHNHAAFVHCGEWFRKFNRGFIERELLNSPFLEEHFQMDRLNQLIRRFLNDETQEHLYLGAASLLSFTLFRKKLDQVPVYSERRRVLCAVS